MVSFSTDNSASLSSSAFPFFFRYDLLASEIADIKKRIRQEIDEKEYDIIGYAMLFSIETGVRVAEIPPLRWEDITDKGIHIHRQQRMTRIKGQPRTFEELPYTKNERKHPKDGRYYPVTEEISSILKTVRCKQKELGIVSDYP